MSTNKDPAGWLDQLNKGYGLDGGGYTFTPESRIIPNLTVYTWDNPDPDYIPWIYGDENSSGYDYRKLGSPLYVFAPNTGHFSAVLWPEAIELGNSIYELVREGNLSETDRECDCHGKLVPFATRGPGHIPLSTEELLELAKVGIAIPPGDKLMWEYTGDSKDTANPFCPFCEGDGYVTSHGGEWALYAGVGEDILHFGRANGEEDTRGRFWVIYDRKTREAIHSARSYLSETPAAHAVRVEGNIRTMFDTDSEWSEDPLTHWESLTIDVHREYCVVIALADLSAPEGGYWISDTFRPRRMDD